MRCSLSASSLPHTRASSAASPRRPAKSLPSLVALLPQAVRQALADRNIEWPGAEPTPELDQAQQLRLPFAQRWRFARRCARLGAWQFLADRPVAAVDGSQIMPSKEMSPPVAAVQVGWYINYHAAGGRYEKGRTL